MLPQHGSYKVLRHHENEPITTKMEPDLIYRGYIRRCYPYYKLLEDKNDYHTNIQPIKTEIV